MKNYLATIVFITGCLLALGQNNNQTKSSTDLLDKQLQQCLDSSKNYTTSGMMECELRARDAWDKELNNYYKLLMEILTSDEKEKLKSSEKNWLAFRDNEIIFSSTMYNNMQGTMWRPAIIQTEVQLIKQRTLELKAYYVDQTAGK